jgi:predicted CoA-binding protein
VTTSRPEPVGGVLTVVPPAETEKVVAAGHEAGIARVWMQQGSESAAAIRFCEEHGIAVVHHECVLMFAEPAGWFHRVHRWVWRLLGRLPS